MGCEGARRSGDLSGGRRQRVIDDRKETEESTVKDGEGDKSDLDEGW